MDDTFFAVSIMFAISATLALFFGIAWLRAQQRIRQLERQGSKSMGDGTLERLEQEVESLATQVSHLAKGQEFLSRFVSDRVPARLRRPEAPGSTPS